MQGARTIGIQGLRWAGGISATLWAGVHFVLASHAAFPHNALATEIYDTFFAFTASLAIVSAIVFLLGVKNLYLPSLIFYVIDLALLTETRTAPALFIGKVLPVNVYVIVSWVLDILLIAFSLALWKLDK